jgi:hypothetical protein
MGSGFWIFSTILAILILGIIIVIAVFTGIVVEKLLTWALSTLNFGKIAENASASNKAEFNKIKLRIKTYLENSSYFGLPPKKVGSTKPEIYGQFFKYIIMKLFAVLFQTFLGVYALWLCKVAQANILPSDFRGAPYTDLPPIIDSIMTQVNFFKLNDEEYSTKLLFQYLYMPDKSANDSRQINSQFSLLNKLREFNESPTITGTTMYFIYMLENLFSLNYTMINVFFSFFNTFYEWFIVLFGGYLLMFVFIVNSILSNLCFIYVFFAGIFTWIWKINKPQVVMEDGKKYEKPNFAQNWLYVTLTAMPMTWIFSLLETIFIINCFIPFLILGNMFVFPLIIMYSLLSGFFLVAKILEGAKVGENYTFSTLYMNKMRYMITPIFIIMSIFVVIGAKTYLGTMERNAAIVACVVVLILLFNIPLTNVNDFATKDKQPYNYAQAEKRTQFNFSSTVLWALTGTINSGDLAINITNQLAKISKFDNYVKKSGEYQNPLPMPGPISNTSSTPTQPTNMQGGKKLFKTFDDDSVNLLQKMQDLNKKIRNNMLSVM